MPLSVLLSGGMSLKFVIARSEVPRSAGKQSARCGEQDRFAALAMTYSGRYFSPAKKNERFCRLPVILFVDMAPR